MSPINNIIAKLAQIGWVVPDIHADVKFFASALGIAGFPNRNTGRLERHRTNAEVW